MDKSSNFKEKRPHGYEVARTQVYTPQQLELFKQMFSQVGPDSFLNRLSKGDQSQFQEIEAPAFRQFNQTQNNIASRFGSKTNGSTASSGNFASALKANRLGLQKSAVSQLMEMSNSLLSQRPYETQLVAKPGKKPNPWLALGAKTAGTVVGSYFGGPAGGKVGGEVGEDFYLAASGNKIKD